MHVMTKALMVLAAVLSIVLATLTMAYTANADRMVQELADARAAVRSAEGALEAQTAESGNIIDTKDQRIDSLEQRLVSAERDLADLRQESTRFRKEVESARRERDAFEDQFAIANEAMKTQAELLTAISEENSELRESESRKRREVIELADQINNLTSRNQVLNETVRTLRVTVAQLQEQLSGGGQVATAGGETSGSSSVLARREFSGEVRAVRGDAGAETLVELDVGTNDSVRENMKLFITRGNNWIADVEVVEAELNTSVARVRLTAEGQSVQPGDRVESQLQ